MSASIAARVGTIGILAVTDGEAPPVDPGWPFPDVPEEAWIEHAYALDHRRRHRSNFGSFVLRAGGEVILVDTGLGPEPPLRFGTAPAELPGSLVQAGLSLADITTVLLTHLHFDHVGWVLADDGESPMFPNARYVAGKADWEHWRRADNPAGDHERAFRRRVLPLERLGLLELTDGELEIAPGISTLPTPGHTPGHLSLLLESAGQRGVVTGDVFHSAAQFAEPEWSHRADVDPVRARATRVELLERLLPGMVVVSGHLPHGSNIGTIALIEGRKYWRGADAAQKTDKS
jgi:glyoxylase-like metal-dependent hydrolase (beta-lactamase superfamily II)